MRKGNIFGLEKKELEEKLAKHVKKVTNRQLSIGIPIANGHAEGVCITHPDGTKEIKRPDGSTKIIKPDGSIEIIKEEK